MSGIYQHPRRLAQTTAAFARLEVDEAEHATVRLARGFLRERPPHPTRERNAVAKHDGEPRAMPEEHVLPREIASAYGPTIM